MKKNRPATTNKFRAPKEPTKRERYSGKYLLASPEEIRELQAALGRGYVTFSPVRRNSAAREAGVMQPTWRRSVSLP